MKGGSRWRGPLADRSTLERQSLPEWLLKSWGQVIRRIDLLQQVGEPAERLLADAADARERILGIDLSDYDDLVTYPADPAGVDWPYERKKILFLQTALSLKIPWSDVFRLTAPYFGPTLCSPFVPGVTLITPEPLFTPPGFDIARQTVGQWREAANVACRAYLDYAAACLESDRRQLIQSGALREFERPRRTTGTTQGQKKAAIVDERTAYRWAVLHYFDGFTWAVLADMELEFRDERAKSKRQCTGKERAEAVERRRSQRKLENQIRTKVTAVLDALRLPRAVCPY